MKISALILASGIMVQAAFAQEKNTSEAPIITTTASAAESNITLDELLAMDKQKFKGRAVATFINSQEAKGYSDLLFRTNAKGILEGIRLKYSSKLYLHIRLVPDALLQQPASGAVWEQELIEKGIIEEIGVVYVMHEGKE